MIDQQNNPAMPPARKANPQPNQPPGRRSLIAEGVKDASQPRQATPEQQEIYNQFVMTAAEMIHAERSRDSVIKRMSQGEPKEAIANTLVTVMEAARLKLNDEGIVVPDEALVPAGEEILNHLLLVAKSAGIVKDLTEDDVWLIATMATDLYMAARERDGTLDMEQVQQIADETQAGAKAGRPPQQGGAAPGGGPPQGGAPMPQRQQMPPQEV